jgi:small multidrug resistance family-3 protein
LASLAWYALAAVCEVGGCFAFWAWLRMQKSPLWLVPGVCALVIFALALTRIDTANAGRAYAAYAGVYLLTSILWLRVVEGVAPDQWDLIGAAVSLLGAAIILFAPRS